ncbi:MAG TPA: TIGR02757 family protein [Prolixibacteraceae bacterium]|nr:TIGR02757 family protein [Prolixibacteraceae bacterium]
MQGEDIDRLKAFLDEKYNEYNTPGFIDGDPVSVPHSFENKEDIEIAALLTATIAWGNRASIIRSAKRMVKEMGSFPHEFLLQASDRDLLPFRHFVHRTFNGSDLLFFLKALRGIYREKGGLQTVFEEGYHRSGTLRGALCHFRTVFLEAPHEKRSEKHVANVAEHASGKRLCMFLRWMVRNDGRGVDFGLWKGIPSSALMLPLDVHTGTVSRSLGLLTRKQNDWKAVEEVTENLRRFDPGDPVKYDFALFGLGVSRIL